MIPDSDLSRASSWKTHSHFSLFFFPDMMKATPRPLGEVRYAWPTDVECFYQSGKGAKRLRVNEAFLARGFPQWLLWTYIFWFVV